MARTIRHLVESLKLDADRARTSGRDPDSERIWLVDRLLADPANQPREAVSEGLHERIMQAVQISKRPTAGRIVPVGLSWALAAAACMLVAIGISSWLRPAARAPAEWTNSVAALNLPVGPQPVMRLVAGTFDQPLREETAKMVSDTRRATRAMVRCVPFTRTAD
jgi:hypothetical protein